MNEDVRGEAARLAGRLRLAREHLDAALPGHANEGGVSDGTVRSGATGITRLDDDEVAEFLRPAADRIAQLLDLAHSLADGTLSPESAGDAARTVADLQPYRRPR